LVVCFSLAFHSTHATRCLAWSHLSLLTIGIWNHPFPDGLVTKYCTLKHAYAVNFFQGQSRLNLRVFSIKPVLTTQPRLKFRQILLIYCLILFACRDCLLTDNATLGTLTTKPECQPSSNISSKHLIFGYSTEQRSQYRKTLYRYVAAGLQCPSTLIFIY
jgi:hypothetical protein